jgi:hypothetical protein
LSDPDPDTEGKGDASDQESDGDMGGDSDDEFNRAKLTEKEATRVLHDEVNFYLSNYFFFSFFLGQYSYPKMFRLYSMTMLM